MKTYSITQKQADLIGTYLIRQPMIETEMLVNTLRSLPEIKPEDKEEDGNIQSDSISE